VNKDLQSFEDGLKSFRTGEPSDQLKQRVTHAAVAAWYGEPTDVPWWIPIKRLGIAAAVTVAIVSFADYSSDRTEIGWPTAHEVQVTESGAKPGDIPEAAFVKHIAIPQRQMDGAAIRGYQEQVRQLLDEQG
jgi:hypothetical protein